MTKFLKPKEIQIGDKTYILSQFPVVEGREICVNYPLSAIPKLGSYKQNEEMMFKLLSFVQVKTDNGTLLPLSNKDVINNHVESWEDLIILEKEMLEYNMTFLQNGRMFHTLKTFAQNFGTSTIQTLIASLVQLSPKDTPPTES